MEHGCFTALVFSISGGMGKAATVFYKRLANLLSTHYNVPYPMVMGWLRCSLNFLLLKSSIMCVCGSRSSSGRPRPLTPVDLSPGCPLFVIYPLVCFFPFLLLFFNSVGVCFVIL